MKISIAASRGFVASLLGILLSSGVASAQRFDDPRPVQRREGLGGIHKAARAIEKNAHDLHDEVDEHFRRSAVYQHLHEHARDIERLARAIHEITDTRDNYRQLRRAVNHLDDEVHHFVDVVEDSKRFRDVPPRAYAHLRREVGQLHRAVIALKRQLD